MNEDRVEVVSFSNMHIDDRIDDGSQGNAWRFTSFYGHPDINQINRSWDMLCLLYDHSPLPWLCVRDFNEILNDNEKMERAIRNVKQMENFR